MQRVAAKRIVPVVVLDRAEDAEPLAEALLTGGLDVMEVTFRTAAAEESIRRIAGRFPEMLLGAGTLLTTETVARARAAGATFGLAPGLNDEVVAAAAAAGMAFTPGVMTPSEIDRALRLGCRLLKFFPAENAGGAKMLAAQAAPFAHTGVRFVPTGGISAGNLADYLKLPVVAAVGGSWMVDRKLVAAGDFAAVTRLTAEALALAAAAL
jgi:2-dehydro-3-deoxyphosphogluconate aldolase / (4S)-4-hydroxy-2-oxoglutarate aldolase